MESYKRTVRLRVLTALNIYNEALLDSGGEGFEEEISYCASKCLSDTELMAFFFLFCCTSDWEKTQRKLNDSFGRNYSVNTVKRYASRAIDRIVVNARKDKKMKAWTQRLKIN